jgi:hypothetical protein
MRRLAWTAAAVACALAFGFAAGRWLPVQSDEAPPKPEGPAPAIAGSPAEPAAGKWRPARTAGPASAAADAAPEALLAVPYLQGYRPAGPAADTVTVHRPDAVWPGLNFYTSGHAPEAVLLDMAGRELHRWSYPSGTSARSSTPTRRPAARSASSSTSGARASCPRARCWRSSRVWGWSSSTPTRTWSGPTAAAPTTTSTWPTTGASGCSTGRARRSRGSAAGRGCWRTSSPCSRRRARCCGGSPSWRPSSARPSRSLLERMAPRPDILHTNTLEILDGRLAARTRPSAGATCSSRSSSSTRWRSSTRARRDRLGPGRPVAQAAPADRRGRRPAPGVRQPGAGPDRSRVLELDPFSQEVLWRYGGDPETDLFSKTLGSCQRLPNGNTLITESENGRALEVTPGARSPGSSAPAPGRRRGDELVAVLFEMERLPPDFPFRGLSGGGDR